MSLTVIDRPIGHKSNALTPAEDYPIVQTFGSVSPQQGWWGAATSEQGNIYFSCHNSASPIKLSPKTRDYSLIGFTRNDINKYSGFRRAPNGNLYAFPWFTSNGTSINVLKVDPTTDTVTTFGNITSGVNRFYGCILANNGMIYGIPFEAGFILKLDPATDTLSAFGSLTNPSCSGAALAPNGKIYCVPTGAGTSILVIDPATDTTYTFGSFATGAKWEGAVLAYNDKIYGIPTTSASPGLLEIDPATDTYRVLPNVALVNNFFGALAPNKKIYTTTESPETTITEIDTRKLTSRNIGITGPSQITGWAGLALSHDGRLFGAPYTSNRILEISRIGQVTPDMYTIPTNIAGLSGTNYNRHNNNV